MPSLPVQDLRHILQHTEGLWREARGERFFLTGGSGFVGTWLLESLLFANDQLDLRLSVVALTRDPARFESKAPRLAAHRAMRLLGGNMVDFPFPEGDFPFVVHAATEPAFAASAAQPMAQFPVDIEGTRRVLELACQSKTRRLLFTSSGAVYGKQPPELSHIPETYAGAPPANDLASAYGQAKRVSEFMCVMYGQACGFDVLIARLFAFVGPLLPLDSNYAAGNFIRDALKGGPIRIGGDGTPYRSYLYAADLAIWLWTILFRGKGAWPYNVGSEAAMTIKELAQSVAGVAAPEAAVEIAVLPVPGAPAARYVPRAERAKQELQLAPIILPEEGIRRTVKWHRGGAQ